MSDFHKITPERAKQIKEALNASRRSGQCLTLDKTSGECVGAQSASAVSGDKVNVLGKFTRHYVH